MIYPMSYEVNSRTKVAVRAQTLYGLFERHEEYIYKSSNSRNVVMPFRKLGKHDSSGDFRSYIRYKLPYNIVNVEPSTYVT
jgi:hypothetical protein